LLSNYFNDTENPVCINELSSIPVASARFLIDESFGINSSELTEEEFADCRREYFQILHRSLVHTHFFKVHESYPSDGEQNFILDEITAGVIYIVRNPLDVACSLANHMDIGVDEVMKHMADETFNFNYTPHKWSSQSPQRLSSWSNHVNSWIENYNGPLLVVRYEDLHSNLHLTVSKMINFLELKLDEKKLNKAQRFSSFSTLKAQEMQKGFREKFPGPNMFFRQGKVGGWRAELTEPQIATIMGDHSGVMRKLNYLDENGTFL
jgi:hypothetical protein